MISVRDIIPDSDYNCWKHFVLACTSLSSSMITLEEVDYAHELLMRFCKDFERLYGPQSITPNMHYHTHLTQRILDFGPIQVFSCLVSRDTMEF